MKILQFIVLQALANVLYFFRESAPDP